MARRYWNSRPTDTPDTRVPTPRRIGQRASSKSGSRRTPSSTFAARLVSEAHVLTQQQVEDIDSEVATRIASAVETVKASPAAGVAAMFDNITTN